MMTRTLFYCVIAVISFHFEYSWWFISGILAVEILFSSWNRWRHINANITPDQSRGGLIALLRIRSAEIGAMYESIRSYQKKTEDGSWIPLFIAEYRSLSHCSVYDEQCDKKDEQYREKANALYNKRFGYNPFFGTLNEPELADIGVALLFWSTSIDSTIRLLKSIPCDTHLSKHVCALLREYRLIQFLSLNGNYHLLFKNWRPLSSLIRERYHMLRMHWEEIIRFHQCSIMITQATCNLPTFILDDVWAENKALGGIERNLPRALSQKNHKSHGWDWDWNNEKAFFQHLQSNPIWIKLYDYDPYIDRNSEQTD